MITINPFEVTGFAYLLTILVRDADGFEGMTYATCFYLPMVEVVECLQDHGFTCYVVSGSDRFICRVFIEGMLDIPYNNVIGMDVQLEATEQGDDAALDHGSQWEMTYRISCSQKSQSWPPGVVRQVQGTFSASSSSLKWAFAASRPSCSPQEI